VSGPTAVPDGIVTVLKADRGSDADVGAVAPWRVPPDAPIGAVGAHLEAVRVFPRLQLGGHLTW
jgi:hypothetical protein